MAFANRWWRQVAYDMKERVDASVPCDVDLPGCLLAGEVECGEVRRSEQQVGNRIDLDPVIFLGPGQAWVARPEAGLDMRQRNSSNFCRAGPTESARRVALHDDQVGLIAKQGYQRRLDIAHVTVRVSLTGAAEIDRGIVRKPVILRSKRGMLPSEDKRRLEPARRKRVSDWS